MPNITHVLGTSFYLFSTDPFIENDGKESSVYSKNLMGSGGGEQRGKMWNVTLLENESGKRLLEWGCSWGVRVGEQRRGSGHPTQTHIKRQLKKASS